MTDIIISIHEQELTFSFNSEAFAEKVLLFEGESHGEKYTAYLVKAAGFLEYSLGHLPSDIDGVRAYIVCDFFSKLSGLFEVAPSQEVIQSLPRYLRPFNSNFIIYAGSFRPWHVGHRECVEQAIANGYQVLICPDRNPWKEERAKNDNPLSQLVSIIDRVNDLEHVSVFSGFLALDKSNPTVNWLAKVEKPNRSLLMGDDSFLSIHKWKQAEELLNELHQIVVVPRLATDEQRNRQIEKLKSLNPEIDVQVLKKHPFEHVSSTAIRNSNN
jgi:nicotinic acid mononucleotide adenylyltransferase